MPEAHGARRALLAVGLVLALSLPAVLAAGRGEPGPVFVARVELRDEIPDLKLLHDLDVDVDGVFDGWARVYLIAEEADKLRRLGFRLTPLDPLDVLGSAGAATGPEPDVPAHYHTYATLTADLQQIAADHPDITRLSSIGQSVQGLELWMMKISGQPEIEQDEREVAYIAAMHGDEVVGKELTFNLIDHLTDNYGTDPRVTDLVDGAEIWILPSMNPDGTALTRRYNANFVDLNRDFPDQFVDPVNTPAGRQPETAAVMAWRDQRRLSLSANYHGGALVANYPFDGNPSGTPVYSPSPDDDVLVSIARTYADGNPAMRVSNSHPSYDDGICNGADWYAINGGIQDWHYVWYGGFDMTLEVSNQKWPAASTLPGFWDDNLESMLSYLERSAEGIRGTVTDSASGQPLDAMIHVVGNDFPTYTDPDVGDYHRTMLPGGYPLEISAVGYSTRLVDAVVAQGPATRYDVALDPLDTDLQPTEGCVDRGTGCDPWLVRGQSADLQVTLRNLGSAASGVGGRLVPTGWYADVTRPDATYPDLQPGEAGSSVAPHHGVLVSASAPAGHRVGFVVEWRADQGSGHGRPFFVPLDAPGCVGALPADVPQAILDRQTTTSLAPMTADLEVTDVRVSVDISHTYRGDLRVEIVSPSGTAVTLHGRSGGSQDDIVGTYGVDLVPFEPLSRLAGEPSAGDWTLRVRDGVPSNTGVLNDWSIEVCGRPFEATPPEMRLHDVRAVPGAVRLEWWTYPGLDSYRVYRSTDPSSAAAFLDVTAEDPDPSDTLFEDASSAPVLYWLVTGVGSNGEGPKGHFGG